MSKSVLFYESEASIQAQIISFLEIEESKRNLFFWRSNSFCGEVTRKNGSKGYIKSNKKGLPDISVILKSGKFLGVEVKSKKGKMSKEQEEVAKLIDNLEAIYICVHSFTEFKRDYDIINK
jgi:VRR-NUC domain